MIAHLNILFLMRAYWVHCSFMTLKCIQFVTIYCIPNLWKKMVICQANIYRMYRTLILSSAIPRDPFAADDILHFREFLLQTADYRFKLHLKWSTSFIISLLFEINKLSYQSEKGFTDSISFGFILNFFLGHYHTRKFKIKEKCSSQINTSFD